MNSENERRYRPWWYSKRICATCVNRIKMGLSAISFWFAIVLPVVYLSVLAVDHESTGAVAVFLGLVALNVLALIGGRPYCSAIEQQ